MTTATAGSFAAFRAKANGAKAAPATKTDSAKASVGAKLKGIVNGKASTANIDTKRVAAKKTPAGPAKKTTPATKKTTPAVNQRVEDKPNDLVVAAATTALVDVLAAAAGKVVEGMDTTETAAAAVTEAPTTDTAATETTSAEAPATTVEQTTTAEAPTTTDQSVGIRFVTSTALPPQMASIDPLRFQPQLAGPESGKELSVDGIVRRYFRQEIKSSAADAMEAADRYLAQVAEQIAAVNKFQPRRGGVAKREGKPVVKSGSKQEQAVEIMSKNVLQPRERVMEMLVTELKVSVDTAKWYYAFVKRNKLA